MTRGTVPVAIAHDYLTQRGGAERVVLALSRAFPEAPIYTTLYDPGGTFPDFADREIITSPLNRVGRLRRDHRLALPVLAPASSAMTVPADVVVASSSGWAHGFRHEGKSLVYCHNPARWLYQAEEYLGDAGRWSPKALAVRVLGPGLKHWDRVAARRADRYLANSTVVQERIRSAYGIEADVVHPPPGLDTTGDQHVPGALADWRDTGYWLVVSRLMTYKNVRQAVEAFRGTDRTLVVVGHGPEGDDLRADLPGNVRIVSDVSDAELRWVYAHARGLVAPSREDFGLTPLEANGWGLPVVALRAGGYLDSVQEGQTGLFFEEPEPDLIRDAVGRAEEVDWDEDALRAHAQAFSEDRFLSRIRAEVRDLQGA